ncbi:MAG: histidine phosphatase family protein [Saprospiraceae bacterium]|nr:histidine phosphatase family protein [Saprospiraceae bacterium]
MFELAFEQVKGLSIAHRAGLILRHSARYPILKDEEVFTVGLTQAGVEQAEALGRHLTKIRQPGRIFSSPIGRCLDTASAIARGARWSQTVNPDYHLSHPYIAPVWSALPICWEEDPVPGQVAELINLVLEGDDTPGVLDIFVTHDTIVASIAGYFMGVGFHYPAYWPEFLEGVLVWRNDTGVHFRWRDDERVIDPWPPPAVRQLEFEY